MIKHYLCLNYSLLAVMKTNVNVRKYGGVMLLLEKRLNKPLQWIICLLHMNELPLRHFFEYVDGATLGLHNYSGQIRKELEKYKEKPIVKFRKITTDIYIYDTHDLNTDQIYMRMISAI
jgi:hypothetical protein